MSPTKILILSLALLAIGCGADSEKSVPVVANREEFTQVLAKAEELSKAGLEKVARDEELTQADRQDLVKAAVQFQALVDYQPRQFAPYLALGMIYRGLGDFPTAERMLRKCLANLPPGKDPAIMETSAEAHYQLSRVLFEGAFYEPALAEASTAIQSNPQNPDYLVSRASAASQLGKNDEAIKDLERALKLDPQHRRARGLMKLIKQ